MDKPASYRDEMKSYARPIILQLGQLLFANAKALARIKARGYGDKHPAVQFLVREKIAFLKQIQELYGEKW